jgi:hypothetical protein
MAGRHETLRYCRTHAAQSGYSDIHGPSMSNHLNF